MYSGMHLEAVIRLVLKSTSLVGKLRYSKHTLGKATNVLKSKDITTDRIIKGLFEFVELYNQSKHDVNHNEKRERLFSESDAIISYFAARLIGIELLELIEHDSLMYSYPIDTSVHKFLKG